MDGATDHPTDTTTADIYHVRFLGDREDPAYGPATDYQMGTRWLSGEHATVTLDDLADHFESCYKFAGSVTIDKHAPGLAYHQWEQAAMANPGETVVRDPRRIRSMAVGDVIVIDGEAYYVDGIGFETVVVPKDVRDSAPAADLADLPEDADPGLFDVVSIETETEGV